MFHLNRNLSTRERVARLCLGLVVALAALQVLPPGAAQLLGYAGAAMLAGTAIIGFCPAYAMFGRKPQDGAK